MKEYSKSLAGFVLGLFARVVVHKYRPKIVMITGSVGKTSTKDAIATVLETRFLVRKSEKSFNGELGVPFTILGVGNPWHNPLAWLKVIKGAFGLMFLPNHYPNMLVLETGADQPGDLARILRIATPDAVVVTRLPEIPVHVEAYTSPEAVREEEFSPAYALAGGAPLIVSADQPHALDMAKGTPARVITYGENSDARVHLSHINFHKTSAKKSIDGMTAQVSIAEEKGVLVVEGSVGRTQLYPAVAAIAVGHAFNIPLPESIAALEGYVPPPGRGRVLVGKNKSTILDDTYNSSPVAVEEALGTLKSFPHAKRRIAVLGDMLELGRYSVQEHERIGALASTSADLIVAVGIRSRVFANTIGKTEIIFFDDSRAAAAAIGDLVKSGDVVLVKGSQSIRTERIVEALLADPADAVKLVRQEKEWKRR